MKTKRNQRGITLIALVVTIIVLIILATVSMNAVFNENGIIKQAEKTKETLKITEEKEAIKLSYLAGNLAEEDKKLEIFEEELKNYYSGENVKIYETDEKYEVAFFNTNRYYEMDNNGNIQGPMKLIMDSTPGKLEGTGSEDDPFTIMSIEDLVYFSKQVNNGETYSGKYIVLGKSLDFKSSLSYVDLKNSEYNDFLEIANSKTTLFEALTNTEYAGFKPIGTFAGIFDGQENKIYHLYENIEDDCGLFKKNNGTIKNLGLIDITLISNQNIGGICAISYGDINNCYVEGEINITQKGKEKKCGILIGQAVSGIYENLYSTGDLTLAASESSKSYFGGIVGLLGNGGSSPVLKHCYNKMNISGISFSFLGGIAGLLMTGNIKECYHIGDLFSAVSDKATTGGIVGDSWIRDAYNVTNCYHIGNISSWRSGGISGGNGSAFNCYSIGKITSSYCGGVILGMNYGAHMVHCFGRRNDDFNRVKLPDGELTENQIINYLSIYNNTGYGYGSNAKIGYRCNVLYDDEFKTQNFVDELNMLITANSEGEITETKQNVWKLDTDNINDGYPILAWQDSKTKE